MRQRAALLPLLSILPGLLAACSKQVVAVKAGYRFQGVQRVAVLGFDDFPGMKGSGSLVAGVFEKHVLAAGHDVVEREQVDKLLKEQAFGATGAVDPRMAKEIGNLLGVDALIFGKITDYIPEKVNVMLVDVKQETRTPSYGGRRNTVQGYTTTKQDQKIPESVSTEAKVGIAVRMVDVGSGEVAWVGSDSETGDTLEEAADDIASRIMKGLKKSWPGP